MSRDLLDRATPPRRRRSGDVAAAVALLVVAASILPFAWMLGVPL